MEVKRACKEVCKKYRVKKPADRGRYDSGQGLCQTCNVWIDYHGAHLKNREKAVIDSVGWFCNCCNYRVRRKPRNIKYKTKLRSSNQERSNFESQIDLSYFNKQRATMIKNIVQCVPTRQEKFDMPSFKNSLLKRGIAIADVETEFSDSIHKIVDLAYVVNPPNKVSMIAEFERIKVMTNDTPTKQDIDKYSKISSIRYDNEFESWKHMLERLGYDPFYRDSAKSNSANIVESVLDETDSEQSDAPPHRIDMDRLNMLIDKTFRLIKSDEGGAYMSDIRMLLEISQEEMSNVATRVVRIEGTSEKEILHNGVLQDVLFQYIEPMEQDDTDE